MHGEIASEWKRSGDKITWSISVPANTTARVYVPNRPEAAVTESGAPIEKAAGLRVTGRDGNFLVCEAGSGSYSMVTTWMDAKG